MDPTLIALASAGGTAVVSAMATDGWERLRTGVVALWVRFRPDSTAELEQDLDTSRTALLETLDSDIDQARQALQSVWQGRMLTLFLEDRTAAAEFKTLLLELAKDGHPGPDMKFHAEAHDHARVYQAGGNQFISER
ncbi:hypothetical protein [Streptomyces sp. NPDC006309]|uniref:hypothetical protein n=1 Tax=Streptomyces sp. NPDC006309 TaxID=3156749 RepID=UPI0033B1B862